MAMLAELNPVTSIVDITPEIAQTLNRRGIEFDRDLLTRPALSQSQLLADIEGLTLASVFTSILPQARLLRLPLMTGALAHALVTLGYDAYSKVALTDAAIIANQLNELAAAGSISAVPSDEIIRTWQLTSAALAASGSVRLTVRTASGTPISSATVTVNGTGHVDHVTPITRETDARGHVFFEDLAPTTHALRVRAAGHLSTAVVARVKLRSYSSLEIRLEAGEHVPVVVDEFTGGLVFDSPTFAIVEQPATLNQLTPIPPLFIREMRASDAVLSSLWRRRVDDTIFVADVTIPLTELPANVALRAVLIADTNGALVVQEGLTPEKARAAFVTARAAELFETLRR